LISLPGPAWRGAGYTPAFLVVDVRGGEGRRRSETASFRARSFPKHHRPPVRAATATLISCALGPLGTNPPGRPARFRCAPGPSAGLPAARPSVQAGGSRPNAVSPHRPDNVLDPLFTQIVVAHLVIGGGTDADPARLGQRLQASGDVDAVVADVAIFDNVAELVSNRGRPIQKAGCWSRAIGRCSTRYAVGPLYGVTLTS